LSANKKDISQAKVTLSFRMSCTLIPLKTNQRLVASIFRYGLHVVEAHQQCRRMEPERFQFQDGADSRKAFASSSSGAAGAGLSEREGATEAIDGTRLGAIRLLLDDFLPYKIQIQVEERES
jgi:hypothetical protein